MIDWPAYWAKPVEERRIDDVLRIVRAGRSTEDGPQSEDEVRRYIASVFAEVSGEAMSVLVRMQKKYGG